MAIQESNSEKAVSLGLHSNAKRLDFYLDQLYRGVELEGRSLLDVGGGSGLLAGMAVADRGAERAVVLEPVMEGSTATVPAQFKALQGSLNLGERFILLPIVLEDLGTEYDPFDIVMLHNSINHIVEDKVDRVPYSLEAQRQYHEFFEVLRSHMRPGGVLIVADCSNRNFFGDVGLRSPFARTIDWRIHQPPEQWAGMLREHGFETESLDWTTYNSLGRAGALLMGNRVASYATRSHFILRMRLTAD